MNRFTQKGLLSFLLLLVCSLVSANAQDIRISEFLVTNTTGIRDNDGSLQGWIELWNPSRTTKYNLSNWKLQFQQPAPDGTITTWTFPSIEILPDDRLIVWASGKNRTTVTAPLHTNFIPNPQGGTLRLLRSANTVASEFVDYPAQVADVSYGRDDNEQALAGSYTNPTPEAPNNHSGPGVAGKVAFSVASGAFTAGFQLELSQVAPVEGAVIRYTTNGSVPTSASTQYTAPISITATTQVRARVFTPGLLPGETETQCYLLIDSTISNFSSKIPVVVLTNFNAGKPVDGSGSPPENLGYAWVFEPSTVNAVVNPSKITNPPTLHGRIAMDLRGSSTLGNPKYNLNIEFRKTRGEEERNVSLLGMPSHSDWVFHAPYSFDRSLVHNPFMYALSNSIGRYATRTRMAEVFIKFNTGTSPVLSYATTNDGSGNPVSGYMGVYNIMEKIRRGSDRVDIKKIERYDNDPVGKTGGYIVKVDRKDAGDAGFTTPREAPGASELANGFAYYYPKEIDLISPQRDPQEQFVRSFFTQFDNSCFSANFRDPVNGYRKYLDVAAAIDHHLLNVWSLNVDGMRLSGYMNVNRGGKIVYGPIWDFDRALCSTDGRDTNPATWRSQTGDLGTNFFNYTWWNRLFQDPDFYQAYIDRWAELRRGPFSPASINALLDQLNNDMTPEAIQRDLTRWGQSKRTWTSPFTGQAFSGQTAEIQRIKDWLQQRANFMDSQWVGGVTVTPAGGNVPVGTTVTLNGPANATIYYTTDGTDPRPPGGAVPSSSPNVQVYNGTPITVGATTRIRARAYKPTHTALTGANNPPAISRWGAPANVRFSTDLPAAAGSLIVTEINYHPADPTPAELAVNPLFSDGDFEFIEVKNVGPVPIDLGGAQFTAGITFAFTGDAAMSLAPGQIAIVAANPQAFAARYGAKPNVVGPYQGNLANDGERLVVTSASGTNILDFTYADTWYPASDGGGYTLINRDQSAPEPAYSTAENWQASTAANGSPGADELPAVTTLGASEITATSVLLKAEVTSNGTVTIPTFVVGNARHDNTSVPSGGVSVAVEKTITDLNPHTQYTYRAEATNAGGTVAGAEFTFTTLNRSPDAQDKMLLYPGKLEAFTLNVLNSDSDPDGDVLTVTAVTQAQHGSVVISEDAKSVLYTPDSEYTGKDTFTYTISDGFGGSDTATITLNRPPNAQDKNLLHPGKRETFTINVLDSDSDPDGDVLTVSAVTQGQNGAIAISEDAKSILYTPAPEYIGNDSFTYTISDGLGGTKTATITLHNAIPVAAADVIASNGEPVTFNPLTNDSDADITDKLQIVSVTQGTVGVVTVTDGKTITYTPGAQFFGRDVFSYTVTDGSAVASASVVVGNTVPIKITGPMKGDQVPQQGAGTVYGSIDLPVAGTFSGEMQSGRVKQRAIFAADGSVLLKVGDPAPGIDGATIAKLGKLNGQAVVATVKAPKGSGVTAANDTVLYGGFGDGSVRILAREGVTSFAGATLKSFLSVDGNGASVFFLAKLGGAGVKATNDVALCVAPSNADARVLVREGDLVDGKSVSSIGTLVFSAGTSAEGRWRSGADAIGVRLSFPRKEQAIYTIPATAQAVDGWTRWGQTNDAFAGAGTAQSFGLPGFGPGSVAFTAQLVRTPGVITAANDQVLLRVNAEGSTLLASEGGPVSGIDGAPLSGLKFQKLADPISGADGRTAFAATLAGSGVKANNRAGLWIADASGAVKLLARAGDLAPDGSRWSSFESMVFPDGVKSGPIFTAKLVADKATPKNSRALWAMGSSGELHPLLRTGMPLQVNGSTRTVKTFVALTPTPGSFGSASGFDDDQHVTALVSFTDGTQALVDIAIP